MMNYNILRKIKMQQSLFKNLTIEDKEGKTTITQEVDVNLLRKFVHDNLGNLLLGLLPHTPPKETSTPSKASPSITKVNSARAYYSEDVQRSLSPQQNMLYKALEALGEACGTDLANYTGLKINVIHDRKAKLLAKGLIVEAGNKVNKETGKTVMYYKIKES